MNHAETLDFLSCLDTNQACMLRGPAGTGKDSLVHEFAGQIGYRVVELALTEMEPTDVVGMPFIQSGERGSPTTTNYAQPYWWPTNEKTIIFLNELDRATEQMFPVAMRLACARKAGGLTLPRGVMIFAACNGEKYQTQPLDQAVLRRFAVIDYQPTVAEWLTWADAHGTNTAVLEFIQQNTAALDTPPELLGKRNIVVPTRASWADLGDYLNRAAKDGKLTKDLAKLAAPFVGRPAAEAFQAWVTAQVRTLNVSGIFEGKVVAQGATLLQASHVVGPVAKEFMERKLVEQANALQFYLDVGKEAFAALFAELPREAATIIQKYPPAARAIAEISRSQR